MSEEEWRDIVGYEGIYQVSNLGRVRQIAKRKGTWPGRILKPAKHRQGYLVVHLCNDHRDMKGYLVHRLVCQSFNGMPPTSKHQVNHRNGKKDDNRASNLEWVTSSQNNFHSCRVLGNIRSPVSYFYSSSRGEANGQAKLTSQDVLSIRALYAQRRANGKRCYTQARLGALFGVSTQTINLIVNRKRWEHI